jgi:hypothetical protein
MNAIAVTDGVVFAIGAVVFIAVATAAFTLAMTRFAELGEEPEDDGSR